MCHSCPGWGFHFASGRNFWKASKAFVFGADPWNLPEANWFSQAGMERLSATKPSIAAWQPRAAPSASAHGLSHSAANLRLNERGRNIRELQELLGHRSLATTARYTQIDRERLKSVVADLALP